MRLLLLVLVVFARSGDASARNTKPPEGFRIWPSSVSPDGKLGVLVPDRDHLKVGEHQNQLVELTTGTMIAVLSSDAVFENQSHAELHPRWSADSTTLIWYVDGKWGSIAVVVVHLEHGVVAWQTDVRELAVQRARAAARAGRPRAYAAATRVKGGSWFRDGFAIDVRPAPGKSVLPLAIQIEMTSNPKGLDDYPVAARLAAAMTGTIDERGNVKLGKLVVKR